MTNDHPSTAHILVKRIFAVQVALIILSTILVVIAVRNDLGFFWFAFLAGVFGASVALLRRIPKSDARFVEQALRSWSTTLMPFLYGGMMAAVAYFLFVSRILSGTEGSGLIATNLFPDFASTGKEAGKVSMSDWLTIRPKELPDAGKLIVWCFLAGYSEGFVSGILGRLEQSSGKD